MPNSPASEAVSYRNFVISELDKKLKFFEPKHKARSVFYFSSVLIRDGFFSHCRERCALQTLYNIVDKSNSSREIVTALHDILLKNVEKFSQQTLVLLRDLIIDGFDNLTLNRLEHEMVGGKTILGKASGQKKFETPSDYYKEFCRLIKLQISPIEMQELNKN